MPMPVETEVAAPVAVDFVVDVPVPPPLVVVEEVVVLLEPDTMSFAPQTPFLTAAPTLDLR